MTSVNNRPEILSKLGVGSGLDTSALIESLVEAEIAGPKEQLEQRESDFSARISAFSQIKNNLKVFKDNLEIIQSNNSLGYQGTTSDSTIATFSANGNSAASAINSQLTVSSLATAHTLTGPSLSSPNNTVGARTLSIAFGTWSADPTQGGGQSHTSNGMTTISVTATSTTTLNQLRDMINNAATDSNNDGEQDVIASVLYDGSNYMLSLKSQFGAANEMKITDNHASSPVYAYDTTDGAQLTQRVAGTDSSFTVDGISMTRDSNSIDDLYSGMTLDLLKTSGTAITIKSEVDLDAAQTSIQDFVTTYNDVMTSLENLRVANDDDENSGAGDGIPDLINTNTDFAGQISLDGGLYNSLYGIEETQGGTNTTLFAVGDRVKDASLPFKFATVDTAGTLTDGVEHPAILNIYLDPNVGNGQNFSVNEVVLGSVSQVRGTVVSWDPAQSLLQVKDVVPFNTGNINVGIGGLKNLIKEGSNTKVVIKEMIKPIVIIHPKSITGLISLNIKDKNAHIVVRTA